jgi:hypothetical protein
MTKRFDSFKYKEDQSIGNITLGLKQIKKSFKDFD